MYLSPGGNRITQLRQNAVASNLPPAVAAVNIAYDAANELTRWNSATNKNNHALQPKILGHAMKFPVISLLRKFLGNEISVNEFCGTLGEWNNLGLWEELTKVERKLLSKYFWNYFDMYAAETLPKSNWWERFRRYMRGEGNIDLQTLRKGSAELLTALEQEQKKQQR
ncbi:MAG: hypothetical protein JSR20_17485 [Nitrospira sp.]|nr:hypothetical protein [Nitrospira sp.]MBX3342044.1 hypothetical protein [Nitrospira sp.]